jgi:hypothetical protein
MKNAYTGYRKPVSGSPPAWIDGWIQTGKEWRLRTVRRERGKWVQGFEPAENFLNSRMFEPSTIGLNTLGTENCAFDIEDLSAASAVIDSSEVLGPMLRTAIFDRHAIYGVEMHWGRLLIPAWLLVNELWVWALDTLPALMCPNSLDVLIGRSCGDAETFDISASTQLASNSPSATALRRIAWLAQSVDARTSWSSVLSHAYNGDLRLVLPKASLSGWVWGVRIPAGILACELSAVRLTFHLPNSKQLIRVATRDYKVPAASEGSCLV